VDASDDRVFPEALLAVAEVCFDYSEGDADYEPHTRYLSPERTASWIRSWTRNEALTGDEFRVIG
jgi:hypothetical protein